MKNSVMKMVAGLLCMLPIACGEDPTETDSPLDNSSQSIIGGAAFSGLPAVGALLYDGQLLCTGTLIESRKVLTAGHCVAGRSASRMSFAIGPNAFQPQEIRKATRLKLHPAYDEVNIRNDIGLVLLSKDASAVPLKVLSHMDSSWKGKRLFFVGYGVNNGYTQTGAGRKRAVWMNLSQVDSTTFGYGGSGRNTCNGDSGGPAFYKDSSNTYFVAGVTSYGDAFCSRFGTDTRADVFLDFIGAPSTTNGCGKETFVGRCDGNQLVWCENNQVHSVNCFAKGLACRYNPSKKYYDCM
jgi:secreted trypsin-like serine protease